MVFKNVSLRGPKRTFATVSVGSFGQGRFDSDMSLVSISSQSSTIKSGPNGIQHRLRVEIAGIDQALKKLNSFLANFDVEFKFTKAHRSCAVLLHGGRGTGKSLLLNKIAETGWGKVFEIDHDAKGTTIRAVFKDAKLSQPSIIFMDDFEELVSKDDSVSRDITKTIGKELDSLIKDHTRNSLPRVLVVAATRDPSSIPMSLKKQGRFKIDVPLPVPDAAARKLILRSLEPQIRPEIKDDALDKLGDRTHAYTPEDLSSLLDAAYEMAEERLKAAETGPDKSYYLEQEDIDSAFQVVRPTAMHDITLKPPSIRWNQIGGQDSVKKALRRAVETPLLVSAVFSLSNRSFKANILSILKE